MSTSTSAVILDQALRKLENRVRRFADDHDPTDNLPSFIKDMEAPEPVFPINHLQEYYAASLACDDAEAAVNVVRELAGISSSDTTDRHSATVGSGFASGGGDLYAR